MSTGLGLGLGWRSELAGLALRRSDLGFVEILAEAFPETRPLPLPLEALRRRGVEVVPHGLRLSLGGAHEPDQERLAHLAGLAERVGAPLVSEHIAFVRAGGLEAGHLLPVPRTREALDVVAANVRIAMASLPVPLALEPIASLFEWPEAEFDEADFIAELLDRTGALLLLDVANLYANARNHGFDPIAVLDRLPLDQLAYVHVAGGTDVGGLYRDTHVHPVPPEVLGLLQELAARQLVPGVMLERDGRYPPFAEIEGELDAIATAARSRQQPHHSARRSRARSLVSVPGGARDSLGMKQSDLVTALIASEPLPAGFDPGRLEATATALRAKRSDEVARVLPMLVDTLGTSSGHASSLCPGRPGIANA